MNSENMIDSSVMVVDLSGSILGNHILLKGIYCITGHFSHGVTKFLSKFIHQSCLSSLQHFTKTCQWSLSYWRLTNDDPYNKEVYSSELLVYLF